ncbi:hypothetical protein GCM10009605_58170 [Nocardiopsis composta]
MRVTAASMANSTRNVAPGISTIRLSCALIPRRAPSGSLIGLPSPAGWTPARSDPEYRDRDPQCPRILDATASGGRRRGFSECWPRVGAVARTGRRGGADRSARDRGGDRPAPAPEG